MAETYRQRLSRKELDEGVIPQNAVLLEMTHSSEGIKSKGGIIVGYNLDDEYPEEDTSHAADLAEIYAKVYKLPEKLTYTEDGLGMSWDCDMELEIGDIVWFNTIESLNAVEILCEDKIFKLIPYQDIYCSKRLYMWGTQLNGRTLRQEKVKMYKVIMLNGYVLCEPLYLKNTSPLAVSEKGEEDKTRGIVRYIGKPNRSYLNPNYVDFQDLEVGDEVIFNPNTPLFSLERKSYLAQFDGNNLYNCVQRRRIALVLSKGN
jgi:hypothetical protein